MSKKIFILAMLILILVSGGVFANGQKESKKNGKVITAKLASEEIEGDFMTVWAENFADHMRTETDGQFDLAVYPYGTLGDTRDINELAQIGVVEFVFTDYAWISAFVPEVQVLALHYIWPEERMPEVLEWVVNNGEFMPFLDKAFRKNGLVPLGIMYEGWQWLTSKKETVKYEDLDGVKVRVMGSKLLVEDHRAYGMSPTPMAYGEVYSGLQTGLIDAQINPLFADYSMKFYEVTDYFTQMWAEPFLGIPAVNMQFYDKLPSDMQKEMKNYFYSNILEAAKWINTRNADDRKKIEKERPDIVWTEWGKEDIAKAKKSAQIVWEEKYPDVAGEGAVEALKILLADIENAKKALNIK